MTYWTEARLRSADEQIPVMDVRELYTLARLLVGELLYQVTGEKHISDEAMERGAESVGIGTPWQEEVESCPSH